MFSVSFRFYRFRNRNNGITTTMLALQKYWRKEVLVLMPWARMPLIHLGVTNA
jgi:hypothetical protein